MATNTVENCAFIMSSFLRAPQSGPSRVMVPARASSGAIKIQIGLSARYSTRVKWKVTPPGEGPAWVLRGEVVYVSPTTLADSTRKASDAVLPLAKAIWSRTVTSSPSHS